jgi:hypothetical protein
MKAIRTAAVGRMETMAPEVREMLAPLRRAPGWRDGCEEGERRRTMTMRAVFRKLFRIFRLFRRPAACALDVAVAARGRAWAEDDPWVVFCLPDLRAINDQW